MLGRVKTTAPYKEIITHKESIAQKYPHTFWDFYDCIMHLALNQFYIICDSELMYADRICFDYTQGEIYVPYIACEYSPIPAQYRNIKQSALLLQKYEDYLIAHHIHIEKYTLFKECKYQKPKLYVLDPTCKSVYYIDLKTLPLRDTLDISREAKDLFRRYLSFCYGAYNEQTTDRYYPLKKSHLSNLELRILRDLNLQYYDSYNNNNLDYNDVRLYKLEDLLPYFTEEELQLTIPYHIRRIAFEGELFCRCAEGLYWENWTKGDMQKLLSHQYYFLKYKQNNVALIFKDKWLFTKHIV